MTTPSLVSLADQAAVVNTQIQRETTESVELLRRLRKRTARLVTVTLSLSVLIVIVITGAFALVPKETSEFFGLQYNVGLQSYSIPSGGSSQVLASTTTVEPETSTSLLADALRPFADASLFLLKAVGSERYAEISSQPTTTTSSQPGPTGPQGLQGLPGTPGENGLNGESALDVTRLPGDLVVGTDAGANRLAIGLENQVLTVINGFPAWQSVSVSGSGLETLGSATANGTSIAALVNSAGGLTIASFVTDEVSQWSNDVGYIAEASVDILTNKTISGIDNILTNIDNASLVHSSVIVTTEGPITGGGAVSLGGPALTLDCTTCLVEGSGLLHMHASGGSDSALIQGGTFNLLAGSNITTLGDGNGTITVASSLTPSFTTVNGLAITSSDGNTLTIASGKTFSVANSLMLSGVDGTSFTLPGMSDDLAGRTAAQTLTNKTLLSPVVTGVVSTTGLTLPAFTASGSITGSDAPAISGFGAINGLVLMAQSDGWSISGGASSRSLTIQGADITVGSTIKPTNTGALAVRSNGANGLSLDTGGGSTLSLGTVNADELNVGRSGVTTSVDGLLAANNTTIGGGATITRHLSATTTFNASSIGSGCNNMAAVTVTGAVIGDTAIATPTPVDSGAETLNMSWSAYVSAANTVTIRGCRISGAVNPPNQTWRVDVWQH